MGSYLDQDSVLPYAHMRSVCPTIHKHTSPQLHTFTKLCKKVMSM